MNDFQVDEIILNHKQKAIRLRRELKTLTSRLTVTDKMVQRILSIKRELRELEGTLEQI